jgi:hypothetical protein
MPKTPLNGCAALRRSCSTIFFDQEGPKVVVLVIMSAGELLLAVSLSTEPTITFGFDQILRKSASASGAMQENSFDFENLLNVFTPLSNKTYTVAS